MEKPSTKHPNNIPVALTRLIGREQEVSEVSSILREQHVRLVCLIGPGGVGKTRLVIEVAARLLNDFADGVWFVDLAPAQGPGSVATSIARTLGIGETNNPTLIQTLRDYVQHKQLLLVLDNFEHVLEAAPFVAELVTTAPQLKVLVTSRARLNLSGELIYSVSPLALPDPVRLGPLDDFTNYGAVALFIERARAISPSFLVTNENARVIAEICVHLDGLPLAIELAAAQTRVLSLNALLVRLKRSLRSLSGWMRDLPLRQQTLRSALDWSYNLLEERERILFRRLSVFDIDWTLEQAHAICVGDDLEVNQTIDLLHGLVDKSLVSIEEHEETGEKRFRMFQVLREYARERLAESGEEEIIQARYYDFSLSAPEKFFRAAGFELHLIDKVSTFLLKPKDKIWANRFSKPIIVESVLGRALDADKIIALSQAAKETVTSKPIIFVLVDHRPTDSGWLQIATLRAEDVQIIPLDDTILKEHQGRQRQILEKQLRRFLGNDQDFYNVRHPVSDRLSFFGREALVEELAESLASGQPVALLGLRKMGKSSLLNVIRERLPCLTALVDLQAGADVLGLYNRILQVWDRAARSKVHQLNWHAPALTDTTNASTEFAAATRSLLEALEGCEMPQRLCVLIDEADLIFPRHDGYDIERYLAIARTFRGLVQEEQGRIMCLVVGVDPSLNRVNRFVGEQNPFYQFFREVYLPSLDFDDCIQMIRNIGSQMGLTYSDAAATFIADVSGGHPFLARQLCSLAFRTLQNRGEVTLAHLEATLLRFIREPGTAELLDEAGLWGEISDPIAWSESQVLANQAVLLALAKTEPQAESNLAWVIQDRRTREHSLVELERRTLLRRTEDNSFEINPRVFRSWIRRYKLGME